ncbi:MAG: hypothetical protein WCC39_03455, partial [Telluria sp.]
MDANQRSEVNNHTNNVANEKWTPGSKGKTADGGPLDHTYPNGPGVEQLGNQGRDMMGTEQRVEQRGAAQDFSSGAVQSQTSGGSGTVQGITDSHDRQMQPKSGAYGMLEEAVGHRPKDTGVNLNEDRDIRREAVRGQMGAQNPAQPDLQGGSMQSGAQGSTSGGTSGGGMHGPQSAPTSLNAGSVGNRQQGSSLYVSDNSTRGGGMRGPAQGEHGNLQGSVQGGQEARQGNTQLGVAGSHAMANRSDAPGGVHQ